MYPNIQKTILFFAVCMLGVGTLLQIANQKDAPSVAIEYRSLNSVDEIVSLTTARIPAIAYTRVISLQSLPVKLKKQKFIELILPAILINKQQLQAQREQLLRLLDQTSLSQADQRWLGQQLQRYNATDPSQLLQKMITLPNSIILAQAAIETGWGTSRFFLKANNVFGIWSFNPGEPRIQASESRAGKAIYVKRYGSLLGAIEDYFLTLGRGNPYQALRHASQKSQDPLQLINHLGSYSELGEVYIQRLRSMINHNNLQQFDQYQLITAVDQG